MSNRRLLSHLLPSYGAIAALAVLFVGWVALRQAEQSGLSEIRSELRAAADFLDQQLGPEIPADRREFARLCRQFDQATGTRVTLLLADGKVDFDTDNPGKWIVHCHNDYHLDGGMATFFSYSG